MMDARAENALTLQRLLGIDDEGSTRILDASVAIIAADDTASLTLAGLIQGLLSRTVSQVVMGEDESSDAEILIGVAEPVGDGRRVHVTIGRDEIVVGSSMARSGGGAPAPIFLLLAACYACGAVIRALCGSPFKFGGSDPIVLIPADIWGDDLSTLWTPRETGKTYLAGAGAIGNAFLFALSKLDARGEIHVVDDDHVSGGNLNRTVLFDEHDVSYPKAKVLAARASAILPGFKVVPRVARLQELPDRSDPRWLEQLVVAVDSRRARRELQSELPHHYFDASTTGIEEVVTSFGTALNGTACMACTYHEDLAEAAHESHIASMLGVNLDDVRASQISPEAALAISKRHPSVSATSVTGLAFDTLFKQMCGTGSLGVDQERQILAPLAFVSVLAGAYLALEFFRRAGSADVAKPFGFWRASPWTSHVISLRATHPPRPGCECCSRKELREIMRGLWGA